MWKRRKIKGEKFKKKKGSNCETLPYKRKHFVSSVQYHYNKC